MSKLGAQVPRISTGTPFEFTAGEDACELAAAYGLVADEWQAAVVSAWLAEYKNTKLVHSRCGISVPRQNGKNAILEMVELYKIIVQGRKMLHTAHEVKTARKAFVRLAGFFENPRKYPDLAQMVREIRRANGQEAIVLDNGGSVEFVARSRGSGRGFTVDDLVCDEAQELTDEQLEALLPTISSAPSGDPQQLYLGTPPAARFREAVFGRMRDHAISGGDRRFSWSEWSIPDDMPAAEGAKGWREHAYDVNPSLGHRLNIGTVGDEVRAMSEEGFCRERLGQWQALKSAAAINPDNWRKRCIDPATVPESGTKVFAVRFSADGLHVALAVGLRASRGAPVHVEGVRFELMRDGLQWLVDFLVTRKGETSEVVIDGKAGVDFLTRELTDEGFPSRAIRPLRVADVIAAHAMFDQAIRAGGMTTIEQPAMVQQVKGAIRRDIGRDGGFGWAASDDNGSVALLEAATLAYWCARTTKRNVRRKAVAL